MYCYVRGDIWCYQCYRVIRVCCLHLPTLVCCTGIIGERGSAYLQRGCPVCCCFVALFCVCCHKFRGNFVHVLSFGVGEVVGFFLKNRYSVTLIVYYHTVSALWEMVYLYYPEVMLTTGDSSAIPSTKLSYVILTHLVPPRRIWCDMNVRTIGTNIIISCSLTHHDNEPM